MFDYDSIAITGTASVGWKFCIVFEVNWNSAGAGFDTVMLLRVHGAIMYIPKDRSTFRISNSPTRFIP